MSKVGWYAAKRGRSEPIRLYLSFVIGHRQNNINSRRYMGALPATSGWVRLEVPAWQVGLEGVTVKGMAFTLYNGQAQQHLVAHQILPVCRANHRHAQ